MKLRHTAALAVIGWCVVMPPLDYRGGAFPRAVAKNAPLSGWLFAQSSHRGTDHTVPVCLQSMQDCEGYRKRMIAEFENYGGLAEEQASASRCIASDDPRLSTHPMTQPPFPLRLPRN